MAAIKCPRGCPAKHDETDLPWWNGHLGVCTGTAAGTTAPRGALMADIPEIIGEKPDKAAEKLAEVTNGPLLMGKISYEDVEFLPKNRDGTIVRTVPRDGQLPQGSRVDVVVVRRKKS